MLDRGDISTSGKCLPKSSICVIDKGELFSLTLMLILSQEIKKIYILLRLCSLLLLDQSILYYGHNLLFMKSLLFPCKSRSSIVRFFRSLLMLQTCWRSFHLENLRITVWLVLPIWWHTSVQSGEISQPSFPKISKTFSSRTSPELRDECPRYQDILVLNIGHLPCAVSPK